jgi:hypothetical protein
MDLHANASGSAPLHIAFCFILIFVERIEQEFGELRAGFSHPVEMLLAHPGDQQYRSSMYFCAAPTNPPCALSRDDSE